VKFSTQNLLSLREWQSHAEVYGDTIEECRLADELGFHTIWLAEHHFSPYGICPSLAPLAGALARETRRARIGTAVVIAPFEHPVRIAEEWAEIDILSGGRLEFGLGRGYQSAARPRARSAPAPHRWPGDPGWEGGSRCPWIAPSWAAAGP
jgi:alkanesulfonate monooxygenase SsuD/methylene tetrahydromethanopterin reductase-like flavin-dependent oxidoreductase (luciferase family)